MLEISFVFVLNARGKKVLISHLIEMSNISENKRALCIGSKKNPLSLAVEKWDNISVQEEAPQKSQENFDLILTDSMGNIPNAIERERVLITLNKVLKENGRLVLCDKLDRIRAYVTILNQMHWNDIEIEQNSYTTITPYAILTANKPGTLTE